MNINNSEGKDYFTQRNNELMAEGACNVTAMIAALSAAGWPVEKLASARYRQPEDALMDFILHDNRVNLEWKFLDPDGKYPPNEWHKVLAFGTNLYLIEKGLLREGGEAVSWGESRKVAQITEAIAGGGAAVMTGIFKAGNRKTIGHVVAVVGYTENPDGSVGDFIIDDSWGDYSTEYRNHNGKNVLMPFVDFFKLLRPCGFCVKMAHIISRFGGYE